MAVAVTEKPIGSDYYFHLNIATFLAHGDLGGAWNYTITLNHFPYAFFLFHFMLVPSVWVGEPLFVARVLQVLLLPATLALTMLLVYRFGNPRAAVYSGMILFGSWAFFDGVLQVRPESLDLLFYPLLVGAVLVGKRWRFVGYAVATVFSHGLASLSMLYGLVFGKFKDRGWRWPLIVGVLLVAPVIVMSLYYMGGAFQHWGTYTLNENPQEALFWQEPLTFIPYYMGASCLGVPFLFKKNKSEFERVVFFGFLGLFLMLPLWADRWLHYISLPLAVLGGLGIDGLRGSLYSTRLEGNWKLGFVLCLLCIFSVYVASYFSFSLGLEGYRWWQPGD